MKAVRTHDTKVYLNENRKNEPKEYFKFANSLFSDFISQKKYPTVLDIGCATGDFLYYLSQTYRNAILSGMDSLPELIEVAKKEVKNCEFFVSDIQDEKQLPNNKYDLIFMFGVHGLFDDCEPWINNISKILHEEGRAYIFGAMNDSDIDVISRIKTSGSEGPYEFGWNTWSKKTLSILLEKKKMNYIFKDFDISIDIEKNTKDPMRTSTIKLETGKRLIVNGAGMIRQQKMLIFSRGSLN